MENNKLLSLKKDWAGLKLASDRAVKRGGNWDNGADAGVFYANLNNAPSDSNSNIGFRCCNNLMIQPDFIFLRKYETELFRITLIQVQAEKLNIKKVSAVSKMIHLRIENCRNFIFFDYFRCKMKTYKNLFEKVVSFENLYNAYLKARKNRNSKAEVLRFTYDLENELIKLQKELLSGDYKLGEYRHFVIFEPKKREISALPFRDRVVQHAIYNIIEPIFDKQFVYDSYACRRGKGMHAGVDRVQGFIRQINEESYVLKCDIEKYFQSVSHEVLKKIIRRKIGDRKLLLLLDKIIDSGIGLNKSQRLFDYEKENQKFSVSQSSYVKFCDKGIPIGNLTSQLFANIYLNELDKFVKHKLRVRYYIRYMDDFVILHESRFYLYKIKEEIRLFLISIKLKLHTKKSEVFPVVLGIDFLGYVIYKDYRLIRKRTIKRFLCRIKKKIKKYDLNVLSFDKLVESFNSWEAYMNHGDSCGLKKSLYQEYFKNVM